MAFEKTYYLARETVRSFGTNILVNSISTSIIALSMLIFGIFLIVFTNLSTLFVHWGGKVRVDAFLAETADHVSIENEILKMPEVEGVGYISKDDALMEFKDMLQGQEWLLKELKENPMPASFRVSLKQGKRTPPDVARVAKKLLGIPGVEDVRYGREWIKKFQALMGILKLGGIVIGGILFLSSVLIISNTIRLTIYSRRDEIEIMRLVGATESFIRSPFFLAGLLQGLLASILSLGLLKLTFVLFLTNISLPLSALGTLQLAFITRPLMIAMALGGMALGAFGSTFALRTFLQE